MPRMERIRDVSIAIAAKIVEHAIKNNNHNLIAVPNISDLNDLIRKFAYWPDPNSHYSKM